ncbi:MAG: GNAT family N-acetyltransferase, partial [Rhodanobacteraceae bacterium]
MNYFTPVHISGLRVSLAPLSMQYLDDLTVAGNDATLWRWLPTAHYRPGSMSAFIKSGMHAQAKRLALCFAIMDAATGKAVGSTRYHHIDVEHRRLEIGVTWIGTTYQ